MNHQLSSSSWEQIRSRLRQSDPAFYELEPGGALALELAADWLLEITPEGRVICQTGMDMEDIQSLLSGGTPEDLGSDELAKQAKYYLQPAVAKYRQRLLEAGFEERIEMNDQYVATLFERMVDFANFDEVGRAVSWCKQVFGAP
jgi:hypothetical protein